MEPIKEKLNLLKKIANEKKSSTQLKLQQQKQVNETELPNTDESINHSNHEQQEINILPSVDANDAMKSTNELINNENSLLVYDDESNHQHQNSTGNNGLIKKLENFYENISEMSSKIDINDNNKIIGVPMSKYVNRIKDFYDKERASSTESLGSKNVLNHNRSQMLKQIKQQDQLKSKPSTNIQTAPLAVPETLAESNSGEVNNSTNNPDDNSETDEASLFSVNSNIAVSNKIDDSNTNNATLVRSNKYINNLRNNFNSIRTDSIENLKRNSFNIQTDPSQFYNSNNQVEKIKEKFSKITNQDNDRILGGINSNRNSSQIESNFDLFISKPFEKEINENPVALAEPNVKDFVKNDTVLAPRNGPKKYQRSKTSDLSDLINTKSDEQRADDINFEFDSLFNKYGFDKKYQTENAIIKSTMCLDRIKTKDENFEPIQTKKLDFNNNLESKLPLQSSQLQQPQLEPPSQLQIAPATKRTKSILKSPSTNTDKSIQFDEKFNESIQKASETLPSQSNVPSSITNIKKNEKSFSNEIDSIKRMLLEPHSIYKSLDNVKLARENNAKNYLVKSRTERVFIKSPTPIREIPAFDKNSKQREILLNDLKYSNELDDGLGKNRNRFIKKKLALRSQSVELSKLIEKNTLNNDLDNFSKPMIQPTIRITSPPINRRNLTRQNAFTKSLGDNLNKMHYNSRSHDNRRRHRHHRHHQKSNHKNHNSHRHKLNNKKSHYKSSSLTNTSESSLSSSEFATKSESSFTSTTSSSSLLSDCENQQFKKHVNFSDKTIKTQVKSDEHDKALRKFNEKLNYSSDDSVCGIPKSSAREIKDVCIHKSRMKEENKHLPVIV